MSAAARAEARRKAILARGNDRLAKLTTSARGEDAPAFIHDDIPGRGAASGLEAFVGEETNMPPPRSVGETVRPSPPPPFPFDMAAMGNSAPDPSVWSEEQQRQFMQALMGGSLDGSLFDQPRIPAHSTPSAPESVNSFESLAASFPQFDASRILGKTPTTPTPTKAPTRLQKFTPLLHVLCTWCLLAFFAFWKEPQAFLDRTHGAVDGGSPSRWAELAWTQPSEQGFGIQLVPFLWAFMTIQIMLHSWRIFSGIDQVRPPTLLALALPHLPPPFPSVILNGLRYLQLGGTFLDDLAAVVFGIGLMVFIGGLLAG
ncbi:hypothetical protein BJ138DRAFT_1173400 [Hygrophoropsis aurantiaca]|uniref:Uncharacterized protein n=1 Tax=Hygrophoropsis aurantiaca TaxID=72124 RepID=A0ACB8A9T3_9AGAM|nr:hypothetical protein BJ138DRAFT_1173400 [Hygrophoropsis aurantiaca]